MEEKYLNKIYQIKQSTYDKLLNEGKIESSIYFVRDFDENNTQISTSIYLGDRLYNKTINDTIVGNDTESIDENENITNNTLQTTPIENIDKTSNYEEYNNVINNGGEIELEQDIVNTETIIE